MIQFRRTCLLLTLSLCVSASLNTLAYSQDQGGVDLPSSHAPFNDEFSDAQIVAVIIAMNDAGIQQGKLAKKSAKNAEVKKFADKVIKTHTQMKAKAQELIRKHHLKADPNLKSEDLRDMAKKNTDLLKKLKGAQFDVAFIDQEIAYHQKIMDLYDLTLIPHAQNEDLKSLLESTSLSLKENLKSGQGVQESIGAKS